MSAPAPAQPVRLLVIHHSASAPSTTRAQIDQWHRDRGFAEIGYHWVMEHDGLLLPGRSLALTGAHAEGHNTGSLGLCVTGDNTRDDWAWTLMQKNQLAQFVRWFLVFHPGAQVLGHRDLPGTHTACPGLDVRKLLRGLGAFEQGG